MSFSYGFSKTAGTFKGLSAGLKDAGEQKLKDILSIKGLRESFKDTKNIYKGQYKNLFKTKMGREHLAKTLGKSAPSLAALTAYGAITSKAIDKMKSPSSDESYQQSYYY